MPSSSLSLALPLVFTKQQKTDRKRLFGFEFMELAEFNKALRKSSALLSGVKQRTRSKTTLIAHPTPTGATPDLRSRTVSEACTADFHVRGPPRTRLLVRSCSERVFQPELLCSFSDPDVLLAPVRRKRTRQREHVKCFAGSEDHVSESAEMAVPHTMSNTVDRAEYKLTEKDLLISNSGGTSLSK